MGPGSFEPGWPLALFPRAVRPPPLQWGRVPSNPDGLPQPGGKHRAELASMGPGSFEPGWPTILRCSRSIYKFDRCEQWIEANGSSSLNGWIFFGMPFISRCTRMHASGSGSRSRMSPLAPLIVIEQIVRPWRLSKERSLPPVKTRNRALPTGCRAALKLRSPIRFCLESDLNSQTALGPRLL